MIEYVCFFYVTATSKSNYSDTNQIAIDICVVLTNALRNGGCSDWANVQSTNWSCKLEHVTSR